MNGRQRIAALSLLVLSTMWSVPVHVSASDTAGGWKLTRQSASAFASLALKCVEKEYPNKPGHVINDAQDVRNPRDLHPVFYGCYDWHSAVHGHWMLVRLLRFFPSLPEAERIRVALGRNISADNVRAEVAYLDQPNRKSFERTYGWAWLLKLAEELHGWDDRDGRQWSKNLAPLTRAIVDRYVDFLPRQTYPIRTGVHPNTAFGIAFAWDYARAVGDTKLESLLVERAMTYYGADTSYPASWEPGGEDFFSPALMEADLIRRVMKPEQFSDWFERFLPDLASRQPKSLLEPAVVTDRTDPKIVHLDGLNLSRAWCMFGITSSLPTDDPSRAVLMNAATRHAKGALAHVTSGNYEGEHWLASFAVYMLTTVDR